MDGGAKESNNTMMVIIIVIILVLLYFAYMSADVWSSRAKRPAVVGTRDGKKVYACRAQFLQPDGLRGSLPGYVLEGENVCNLYKSDPTPRYDVLDRNELYKWGKTAKNRVRWGNLVLPAEVKKSLADEDKKRLDGHSLNMYVCDAKYGDAVVPGLTEKGDSVCSPIWDTESEMVADSMRHLNFE